MLKLPRLISDGCVLQQGEQTRIWGFSTPGESIRSRLLDREMITQADGGGRWELGYSWLPSGGPYLLELEGGRQRISLKVYVGEVWVCSGQSNMELPIERVKDQYPAELFSSGAPAVRLFSVTECYDFHTPRQDYLEGEWKGCSREELDRWSAFSWFFASYLQEVRNVPVGIICASLGGSRIEAWMSREALAEYPEFLRVAEQYKDDGFVKSYLAGLDEEEQQWYRELARIEKKDGEWQDIRLPGFLEENGITDFNGVIYLKRTFLVPESMAGKTAALWLGTLVDCDSTYINGSLVGVTGYQYPPRKYQLPEGLLKAGENEIMIRLVCRDGSGRVTPGKPLKLFRGETLIRLEGTWQYQIGCRCRPAPRADFISRKPTGLYQGMLAPCQSFGVRGVVWYQGESNDRRAGQYEGLLRRLICSWRKQWQQQRLPFIIIQLPNFDIDLPKKGSGWPEIREAQGRAGSLPEVAVTVNLDLGEDNDLHPLRKREVAYRAAMAAGGMVYGEAVVWKSPVMQSWQVQDNQILVIFDTGDGKALVTPSGTVPEGFELAGSDRKYHPAAAEIKGNQVLVSSSLVRRPTAVRYGWCNAPGAGLLYNRSGLPAQPFRTA